MHTYLRTYVHTYLVGRYVEMLPLAYALPLEYSEQHTRPDDDDGDAVNPSYMQTYVPTYLPTYLRADTS